jgi:hypothetical protein
MSDVYRCSLCDQVFSAEQIETFQMARIPARYGWRFYFESVGRAERVHCLRTPEEEQK